MIRQLNSEVIARIAAGEVIERPSSAVKELLENSMDAGATRVRVDVIAGGKKTIRITDNGKGILREELPLALERHATSKLVSVEDLDSIATLGFRGEALASLDAVAHVAVISKPADQDVAAQITKGSVQSAAHDNGTTIVVEHLFDGLPARKKFLKSDAAESRAVVQMVRHYSLCYPHVDFSVYVDGNIAYSVRPQESLERAASVFGVAQDQLREFSSTFEGIRVNGIIGLPPLMKPNRAAQYFFCNNRFIYSPALQRALLDGFKGFIPLQNYPMGFIHIHVPADQLDVNVHPAKTTIKFVDEGLVFRAVFHGVQDCLQETGSVQEVTDSQAQLFAPTTQVEVPVVKEFSSVRYQTTLTSEESDASIDVSTEEESEQKDTDFFPFVVLDVIGKTYVVSSHPSGLALTDFHAAFERLNYDVFSQQISSGNVATQKLLQPAVLQVREDVKQVLHEHTSLFASWGVFFEDFGPESIAVTELPVLLGRQIQPSVFTDIEDVHDLETVLKKKKESIIAMMACKASPRSGDTIDLAVARQLLEDLHSQQLHWTCPHGRPVMLLMNFDRLGTLFHRH